MFASFVTFPEEFASCLTAIKIHVFDREMENERSFISTMAIVNGACTTPTLHSVGRTEPIANITLCRIEHHSLSISVDEFCREDSNWDLIVVLYVKRIVRTARFDINYELIRKVSSCRPT